MDNTTFSIMGSCVSRDIFSINDCQEYTINRFIQSVSPISASVSPVIDMDYQDLIVEVIDNFNITSFYKRCFSLGITGKAFDYLFEVPSDYLIIDMSCCRFDLMICSGGKILPKISGQNYPEILDTVVKKYNLPEFTEVISDDNEIISLMNQLLPKYFEKILENYPLERIILVETDAAAFYLNKKGTVTEFKNTVIESWKKRIHHGEEIAREYLHGCHIIEFPEYVFADENHKWKLAQLHYVQEYYEYAFQAIKIILTGNREKELLNILKNQYSRTCQEKYYPNLYKTISSISNLRSEKSRLLKYCDYFRDIFINKEKYDNILIFFQIKKYKSCAIYGLSTVGIFYIDLLEKHSIIVDYVVENGDESMYKNRILRLKRDTNIYPKTDIIIIADVMNIQAIKNKVSKTTSIPLIDIYEITDKKMITI
ncbi:DUF6270 domain-containing protein [Bilophila wadsworthia]|uniref:DUF6270 domain-containing protein n=1 Tax=Bilophila wadsworthia TaxID=35833 RepID=UPI00352056DE